LIYQPSSAWTYKFLYGRGFRNPTAFELFFDDDRSGEGNPDARQESADTVEVDVERRIGKRINMVGAVYAYRLRDLLVGVYAPNGLLQYQNVGRIHASGFEIEMDSRLWERLAATASYTFQKSRDDVADTVLSNSPQHVAKLRFAIPLGRRLDAASVMQYHSSRTTLSGATVRPVYLADFIFTSRRMLPNLDIQFGLHNAFNRQYADPVALFSRVDRMPQRGRAFVVQFVARPAR
jgi:iron complex outermembrane receptor protein